MGRRPGRLSGKVARQRRWWHRRRHQLIAGAVALATAGTVGAVAVARDGSSTPSGTAWKSDLVADLATPTQATVGYLQVVNEWRSGAADAAQMRAAAGRATDRYRQARDILADRSPFAPAPRALENYRAAFAVYLEHSRMATLSTSITDKPLLRQTHLHLGRLRYLADRFYDIGNDEMAPYTPDDRDGADVTFERTADVPSFAAGTLAPGPPLAAPQPAGAERRYQPERPEVGFADWTDIVADSAIPSLSEVLVAVDVDDAEDLDVLASRLTAASDALYGAPDPEGERLLSTRIQLGLLLQAEAVRAAQIGALLPPDLRAQAREIATTLVDLGGQMWDDRLPPRED